jgi:hypothetical protein
MRVLIDRQIFFIVNITNEFSLKDPAKKLCFVKIFIEAQEAHKNE